MRDRSESGIVGCWIEAQVGSDSDGIVGSASESGGKWNLGMRGSEREWDRSQMGPGLSEIKARLRTEAHGTVGCGNSSQVGAKADRIVFGYAAGSVPCVAFSAV